MASSTERWRKWKATDPLAREKLRDKHRKWRAANPEKCKERRARWIQRNPRHRPEYMFQWRKRNREKILAQKLRSLKPEDSLFYAFSSMDAYQGYEINFITGQKTPLEILIEKEENNGLY